jgi:gamma-glutamylcyclotransferase (GGCT)/AIG2-like uncharacterized protein YtfP
VSPQGEGLAASLRDHRLRFNKKSEIDGSGKANVESHPGGQVWGVLYTIPDADLETLDKGEVGYYRAQLPVHTTDPDITDITEAWVYLASKPSDNPALRPYTWYKRFLVEGAREHSLPLEYVAELERIEAIEDSNQQRDRDKRALSVLKITQYKIDRYVRTG